MTLPNNYYEVLDKGYVGLVNTMGSDLDIANSARVSYNKLSHLDEHGNLSLKDGKLIDFLWKENHTSPFRHCVMSFEIYAPLMVARQHWKHVVASSHIDDQVGWNESSRRYVTENEEFYIPSMEEWRMAPENSKQGSGEPIINSWSVFFSEELKDYVQTGLRLYEKALEQGIAPEMARLFLPAYGMYVRYRWTASLHSIMNFLQLRLDSHSQKEIRDYAEVISRLVQEHFPYAHSLLENKND